MVAVIKEDGPEDEQISLVDWLKKLHGNLTDLEMLVQRMPQHDKAQFANEERPAIYLVQEMIEQLTKQANGKS